MSASGETVEARLPAGTVTFLLTDVEGSTSRWDRDPDGMAVVIERQEEILHGVIERCRGVRPLEQGEGDSVIAVFERASDAVRAALEAQLALTAQVWPEGLEVRVRMALHSGDARLRGERNYAGPVLNRCARLRALAAGGQVFVSAATHALLVNELPAGVSLVEVGRPSLKGLERVEPVYQLCHQDLPGEPGRLETPAEATVRPGLPGVLAAYGREPLIGRDRELLVLGEAAWAGEGRRAVLVLGEPGIGKTRLAAAAAADAYTAGSVVVLARCPPGATVPFEPWVRAIGELARAGDDQWRVRLARTAGAELSALVPELTEHATVTDSRGAGSLVAAEGARYRLLQGISAALAIAADDAPLLVVLDDAHWCDPASAQALAHLLDTPPASGLVLVVTARDREMRRGHPVSRTLADLRRTGDLAELHLAGLDAAGLAALVAARVGRAITPKLASRLFARTAGNPFFVAELARDLDERGKLRDSETLDSTPVPDAVAGLVEERLCRLDPVTERLLVAVAAIGPSASVALAATAAAVSPEDAAHAVQQAIAERLVDEVPASTPTVAFPHALIREALTASLGDAAGARLHQAIARALADDPDAGPAELARHHSLAVPITGPEPAIAAHQTAAQAAAAGHDHEQAAVQLRDALALIPETHYAIRAPLLLELGEQQLLAADLPRAREAFRAAGNAARATDDTGTLARAALGFAGGDIGFGWELPGDDESTVLLLREGLDALGGTEPRLALRMIARLSLALVYGDDEPTLARLVTAADELNRRLASPESEVLAGVTRLLAVFGRSPDPYAGFERLDGFAELIDAAERSSRDDLLLRALGWSAHTHYIRGRIAECEQAIEAVARITERLGSPRFAWEVDVLRGNRLVDRGDRRDGEALVRRGGEIVRRLRPDIHVAVEFTLLVTTGWIYDGDRTTSRVVFEAMEAAGPWGLPPAVATMGAAIEGDYDTVRRRLASLLTDDLAALRRPDGHLPLAFCYLAWAATLAGDRTAGARLRQLLEPLRPYLLMAAPAVSLGQLPEWHIGRLELLAGNPDQAAVELRAAVERADALDLALFTGWIRVDLAIALHRRAQTGDHEQALEVLAEGEALAQHHQMRWVIDQAAIARAELEGRDPPTPVAQSKERDRPVRALAARTSRRALGAFVRDQNDETLERRFAEPRRQRALLRAMARGFQPAHAAGFQGVIAYELEPFAIELPPDAPWRWAIEVDSRAGHARLLESAPLDAAVTIHFGLAEWVRVAAGVTNSITAMAAGRCSIEGDVILAARLETMFGAV